MADVTVVDDDCVKTCEPLAVLRCCGDRGVTHCSIEVASLLSGYENVGSVGVKDDITWAQAQHCVATQDEEKRCQK